METPGGRTTANAQLSVWIDQELCTGDGLCVQLAPHVFEFDVDGLAYVKDADGALLDAPGASVPVPSRCLADVLESARGCPGDCIFVADAAGTVIAGPGAE